MSSNLPAEITQRGISTEVWSALKNSIFPGAADQSVLMAWDYCAARQLDIMLKPVHLVPMFVKDKNNGDIGSMRDVVMPGIGLYRIQADRAGNYAGMSAPTFGDTITADLGGEKVSYPEWCEITVSKIVGDRVVEFTAREYWIENYATAGRDTKKPNAMWLKRPTGQLVKCTEAQTLRRGWPELGAQPTYEEMEGKEIDITAKSNVVSEPKEIPFYEQEKFDKNIGAWTQLIASRKCSAEEVIAKVESKAKLTKEMKEQIKNIKPEKTHENA